MDTISQPPDLVGLCQGKEPPVPIEYRRLGRLQSQSRNFGGEKIFFTLIEIEQSTEDWSSKHLLYVDKTSSLTSLNTMWHS